MRDAVRRVVDERVDAILERIGAFAQPPVTDKPLTFNGVEWQPDPREMRPEQRAEIAKLNEQLDILHGAYRRFHNKGHGIQMGELDTFDQVFAERQRTGKANPK